jgi:ribose 1,5-bisphosphokinase
MPHSWGTLVLVVGPSGVGKDSIIREAQAIFANNRDVVFPRRVVTRPATAAAEDHHSVTEMAFALAVAKGDYAVWWRAHGHGYGIPISIDDDLRFGRTVVFNCSRTVLDEVQKHYPSVVVTDIRVSPHVLVDRIVARGRETRDEAVQRVSRIVPPYPSGLTLQTIYNDAELETAVRSFCDFVRVLNHFSPDPGRDTLDHEHQHKDRDDGGGRLVIVK